MGTAATTIDIPSAQSRMPAITQASEGAAILSMIERVASDPSVDLDRLERLMRLRDETVARNARVAFNAALAEMQTELPVIGERGSIKDRNGKAQSTYALWEDINQAIRPALSKHGFFLGFRIGRAPDRIMVTGVLSHRDGHEVETSIELPLDTSGSKNAVQAVGSSTSYGKRYTAGALLNLTSRAFEDQDDDGRTAGSGGAIDADQVEHLRKALSQPGQDEKRFLKFFKLQSLEEMPDGQFSEAMQMIAAQEAARRAQP